MAMAALEPLIGVWSIEARFENLPPGGEPGRVTFEWMPGREFLVQRWEVPHPEAPDGIAIIGPNPKGEGYLQHYFDSRGVARVYEMSFEDGTWTLERSREDFSPLDFAQRYSGSLSRDGARIEGAWEICQDGSTWAHDFDLIHTRLG
jgi:hypothetical protein